MTAIKARRQVFRLVKLLLFLLCLLALTVASLVLLLRNRDGTSLFSSWKTVDPKMAQSMDVFFDDQTPPSLTLEGGDSINVEIGGQYTEPGYCASDPHGNDLTNRVTASINGDFLCYTVTDLLGNAVTEKRSITYVDTTPPEITLNEGSDIHITAGTEFQDPGYTAIDNSDGDVTANVSVSGSVEKYKLGTYTVTYTVSDSLGNQNVVERQVHVDAAPQPSVVEPNGKVIYLTFDDGPGPYTEKLLDILDQYGVKVTFFVTNQDEDYQDMIGEEFRRGHSVAIHTYSHDFETVYASEDAYFEDLNKMQEIIVEQTGQETTLVRFPGGSSNTVSENYCYGIMSALAEDLENMGYQYFDWNVSSGDAGDTTDTDTVFSNVTEDILSNGDNPHVVLQHDIHDFSVDAVEHIILWGLENGYTFLPLDSSSPTVHHGINN